ncbi:MAG: hypothetical protein ACRED0_12590 [Gammaproteobacteria bacterium]
MLVPRGVTLALCLFILWILLSGHWNPWLLNMDLGSVLLVVGITLRMDITGHEGHPKRGRPADRTGVPASENGLEHVTERRLCRTQLVVLLQVIQISGPEPKH